jgi:hypothetical protein
MMTLLDTPNFGLTRVGQGEELSKDGYKALDKDRNTLDAILKALATHTHTGATALTAPYAGPTFSVSTSGGLLPAGQTYYYSVGYVDQYGLETAASAEVSVSTTAAIPAPSGINLTSSSGGSLPGGLYSYIVTFVQSTGGETLGSAAYSITIDGTVSGNAIILDLPALAAGANNYRIYRARPGQGQFYYVTDTTSDPFTDTGINEDKTKVTPSTNTTNAFNKVTLTIPGTAAAPGSIPPGVKAWRIYRTDNPGNYKGSNLVHEVSEPTTPGGTDLRTTWDDVAVGMLTGAPQQNNSTISMPPPLSAGSFAAELATTNLVTNPSFETNTTGWPLTDSGGASVTFTTAALNAVGGTTSAKLVNTNSGEDDYIKYTLTVSASTQYTISAYSYVDAAVPLTGTALGSRGMYITDGTSVVSTTLDQTSTYVGWYRHIVTISTAVGATTVQIRLYAPKGTVYWDSVQAETGNVATAYCDGSLGDGYAWTGTAHASTSTRSYGSTVIPKLSVLDTISTGASIFVTTGAIKFGSPIAGSIQASGTSVTLITNSNTVFLAQADGLKVFRNIASGQNTNSVEFQSSGSSALTKVDSSGRVGVGYGTTALTSALQVQPFATNAAAVTVQALASQSVDILNINNSGGTPQMSFTNAGLLKFTSSALSTTTASAGANGALPATVQGYFSVVDSAGTTRKIPYYV